ncbi:hypothetical protein RE428_24860 [Marinobacter nanhaiticus D15-8W]|nr:hypothetical protein RE428_24860 [Marinobacter nanhaiticus D15-8W]
MGAVEIGLALLLGILAFRIITLSRFQETPLLTTTHPAGESGSSHASLTAATATRDAYQRVATRHARRTAHTADLVTQLHILTSVQMTDTRRQGLDLKYASKPLKVMAAAYFYGATCGLTFSDGHDREKIADAAIKVIQHALDLGEVSVHQMLATLTASSSALHCYRNGLEGAEYWCAHRFVPDEHSLYASLTANALI